MAAATRLLIHKMRDVTVVNLNDSSILDALQVEQIGEELFDLVTAKACKKIVLDFSKVRFLSSSALGILIRLRKEAQDIKGKIVFCGLRKDLRQIFKITNLEKLFDFYDNEEQALNAFGVTTSG